MAGKGDNRRPQQVPHETYSSNWEATFGRRFDYTYDDHNSSPSPAGGDNGTSDSPSEGSKSTPCDGRHRWRVVATGGELVEPACEACGARLTDGLWQPTGETTPERVEAYIARRDVTKTE